MSAQHRFGRRAGDLNRQGCHPWSFGATRSLISLCAAMLLSLLAVPPALAAGGPEVLLEGLQCTSSGNCSAIGNYYDALAHGQGVVWNETNGSWSRGVEVLPPSNASTDPFDYANESGALDSIACPEAGSCVAVGYYLDRDDNIDALVVNEKDGVWQPAAELSTPSNTFKSEHPTTTQQTGFAGLSSVSCVSAGNCTAVGYYLDDTGSVDGLIAYETGGVWGAGTEVSPPAAGNDAPAPINLLSTVSCTSDNVCNAAGTYTDNNGNYQGWLLGETDGTVSTNTTAVMPSGPDTPSTDPSPELTSISCVAGGNCAAVGAYTVSDVVGQDTVNNEEDLMLTAVDGSWNQAVEATLPSDAALPNADAQNTALLSVDCPAAQECTAVGYYTDRVGNLQGVLLDQTGTNTWNQTEVELPSGAATAMDSQQSIPAPVSCSSPGNCLAAGVYDTSTGKEESLLITESGGSWSESPMQLPSNAGAEQEIGGLSGASCPLSSSNNDCTTAGQYEDSGGNFEAFAATENSNGTWGTSTELAVPAASTAELELTLPAVLKPGGKNATIPRIVKLRGFSFQYVAVEAGTLTISWTARDHGHLRVIADVTDRPNGTKTITAKVHLTAIGRKLLQGAKKVVVHTKAQFNPSSGPGVSATETFTLRK